MKKILLCLVAVALSASVFAQNERVFGVRAGLNITNINFKFGSESESIDSRASFHAGFAYQQPILRSLPLYFETGLYFSGRGASGNANELFGDDEIEFTGKAKFNMYYLQLPAMVSWHFNFGNVSLQPAVGVFYGFGISGKMKVEGEKYSVFNDDDDSHMFKRSDFGMRFGLGATFKKHYYLGVGYDLGLMNTLKDSGDLKGKQRSFFISLGYNF